MTKQQEKHFKSFIKNNCKYARSRLPNERSNVVACIKAAALVGIALEAELQRYKLQYGMTDEERLEIIVFLYLNNI